MAENEVDKDRERGQNPKPASIDSGINDSDNGYAVNNYDINDSGKGGPKIFSREIEDEMKCSYIDYAMSVIVGRALPDVRDGLKPVHRRVLFSMLELGLFHNKPFKKCARIVGDCLGKYHPHGDMAVYDALVRLAQPFSMRYALIEGQGNFGSIDGDSAAAMRYTEARLAETAEDMLADIDKETVDFVLNFDSTLKEPVVLPSKLPNLLINGSSGIAVGMATNIPPHNISEIANAIIALIDNPEMEDEKLITIVRGPDFPTAGIIYGTEGIRDAYTTGSGRIIVRARAEIEEHKNKRQIIIKEIPYAVEKSALIEEIADAVKKGYINGIADLRDESDKEGIRVIIELNHDVKPELVLNQLFKHTRMQSTFGVIMLALVNNVPKILTLKQMISLFIEHRKKVVIRRTGFELARAEERVHILSGLLIALKNIDDVVKKIKGSKTVNEAKEVLETDYGLTEIQARAILDMKLQKLASLEQEKVVEEHTQLLGLIKKLKEILASDAEILKIVKDETSELMKKYSDKRRTEILDMEYREIAVEDVIKEEKVVVTLTRQGYIKRTPLSEYRLQKRGGKGLIGTATKEEDFVEHLRIVSSHSHMLFFTNNGSVYRMKTYDIPEAQRSARGKPIVNILNLKSKERITEIIGLDRFESDKYIIIATKRGIIKRSPLAEYDTNRASIKAIVLNKEDEVVGVNIGDGSREIMLATRKGQAARFREEEVRVMGRVTGGVIGVRLEENDYVVEMIIADESRQLLTVTQNGFGKRTEISEYRLTGRAVKGVTNIKLGEKTGDVVGVKAVIPSDELMLITKSGSAIRFPVEQASLVGRHAQGVRLIRLEENDYVVSVAKIAMEKLETGGGVNEGPAGLEGIPAAEEDSDENSRESEGENNNG